MAFKSKSQVRYMYLKHPKKAEEFASKTSNIKDLPENKRSPWLDMNKKEKK